MVRSLLVHLVLFSYLLTIFFIFLYCRRPVGPLGPMASFIRLDTCHLEFLIHLCTLFHFISPFVLHHSSWSLSKSWAFLDHKAMYLGVRNSLLGWIHELFEPLITTIPSLSPSTITATMTATFSFVSFTDYTVGLTQTYVSSFPWTSVRLLKLSLRTSFFTYLFTESFLEQTYILAPHYLLLPWD